MPTGDMLAELRAIYAELDAFLDGFTCETSGDCCHFGRTGREPYPTAVEVAELERALRARGGAPKKRLPTVERRCALLDERGRCSVYASRPFGCRTFFCERARGPVGEAPPKQRDREIVRMSRAIADLSTRFHPADPGARPLSRVVWESKRR
ncbi:MAG TPA: YkgJ family cysteine cluster protein [Labilithrix sp.]|jgi:Fe-S-cluster containining protein